MPTKLDTHTCFREVCSQWFSQWPIIFSGAKALAYTITTFANKAIFRGANELKSLVAVMVGYLDM